MSSGRQESVPVASTPVLTNWWPVDDGWVLPQDPIVSPAAAALVGAVLVDAESEAAAPDSERVDLNTASVDELCAVQGIGKGKARAIVSHRETNGAFPNVEALADVRGFGTKTVAKLADQLTVGS